MTTDLPDLPADATVGQRIRGWRSFRGFSLADLGRVAEMDRGHLSRIENDRVRPGADTIERLAAVFGCREVDLDPTFELETNRSVRWRMVQNRAEQLKGDAAEAFLQLAESFFDGIATGDPDRLMEIVLDSSASRLERLARAFRRAVRTGMAPDDSSKAMHRWLGTDHASVIAWLDDGGACPAIITRDPSQGDDAKHRLDILDLTVPKIRRLPRFRLVPQHITSYPVAAEKFFEFNDGGAATPATEAEGDYDGPYMVERGTSIPLVVWPQGDQEVWESRSPVQGWPVRKGDLVVVEPQPIGRIAEGATVIAEWLRGHWFARYRQDARGRHVVTIRGVDHIVKPDGPVSITRTVLYIVTRQLDGDTYGPARNELVPVLGRLALSDGELLEEELLKELRTGGDK